MNGFPQRSHFRIGLGDMDPKEKRSLFWQFVVVTAGAAGVLTLMAVVIYALFGTG